MWKHLCRYLSHRRNPSRVWYDEISYRTRCVRCDADLIKDRNGDWRVFDPEQDNRQHRVTKKVSLRRDAG